ncbi:MAG: thioredoxin family protein [Saprospiraceae bacterium]|nr:thioredoxin family protein [Saprospiraceae bacterium]
MRQLLFTFLLFALSIYTVEAKGIKFHNDILDEALAMAKAEGKYVFIDTYAPWCAPCKRMNKVFSDPSVSNLYNDKFINVKINMDGALGKEMLMKYDVVWLPTLLILDQEGNVKYKIDKEAQANEMIQMAHNALDPNYRFYNKPTLSKSPMANNYVKKESPRVSKPLTYKPKEKEVILGVKDVPSKPEKILYVYDENSSNTNPEMLYHEAYLQMQLLSPKTTAAAQKYLKTQKDWKTEKNIKFIFDFTENVRSPFFEFLSDNLPQFYEYVGQEKTMQNLQIMVYMRLNNGYPRPTIKEAKRLYKLIESKNPEEKAHLYYMQRLKLEKKWIDLVQHCDNYLKNINPINIEVLKESTLLKIDKSLKGLPQSLQFIDYLLSKEIEDSNLFILKCKVLSHLGKSSEAKKLAKKTLKIIQSNGEDSSEIEALLAELS